MATLNLLAKNLRHIARTTTSSPTAPISDSQYETGFDIRMKGGEERTYQDFIVPQLSQSLVRLLQSRVSISVLEIAPGPKSVLEYLPDHIKRRISRYAAFEPNGLFAASLQQWLPVLEEEASLEAPPVIHDIPFDLTDKTNIALNSETNTGAERFDVVLFCHSMYDMSPKRKLVQRALDTLTNQPADAMVILFHHEKPLQLEGGLVCHQTTSYPDGETSITDEDETIDNFSRFIAGLKIQDIDEERAVRMAWREECRSLGRRKQAHPGRLYFSSPNIMTVFTRAAAMVPELTALVPSALIKPQGIAPVPDRTQRLIVLVSGESCAGKDYCAETWVSVFNASTRAAVTAKCISISDSTKQSYAAATGADLERLRTDRTYKEQHRRGIVALFEAQQQQRPNLAKENFLQVVRNASGVDVLFITGIRDEAPVSALSYLVPDSKVLEVNVQASRDTQQARRGCRDGGDDRDIQHDRDSNSSPTFVFQNDEVGPDGVKRFAQHCLLPLVSEELQRLRRILRQIPDFPRRGICFQDVLGIVQLPGGLAHCTSLLQTHFELRNDWANVDAIVGCETGGFLLAGPLALRVNKPLALIRKSAKRPPPTLRVVKSLSHISGAASRSSQKEELEVDRSQKEELEVDRNVLSKGASVVIVDDVLATGKTLCAMMRLLSEIGIAAEKISVLVVVEFPVHRGRDLLRQYGFGRCTIQTLLVSGHE